jgi:hypothetical protein
MKFIVLSPNDKPKTIEQPEIALADLQHWVEGYVECPYIPGLNEAGVTLWANEEGLIQQMQPNLAINHPDFFETMVIVGPVVFTSSNKSGDTTGLNAKQLKLVTEWIEQNRFSAGVLR